MIRIQQFDNTNRKQVIVQDLGIFNRIFEQEIETYHQRQNQKIQLKKRNSVQQSFIFNQNQKNNIQQYPLQLMIQKDYPQTEFIEILIRLKKNKQIINPLQLVINSNIEADNPEVLFYVLSDQMRRTQKQFFMSLQSDKSLMDSFHYLLTSTSEYIQTYSLILQETQTLNYKQIVSDNYFREQFLTKIRNSLSICLQVRENQIKIIALEMGSIKVIFELIDHTGIIHLSENLQELQEQFPNTKPQLQLHNYFKQAALNINDFDPNYNMDWDEQIFGNYDDRGPKGRTQPYFFPIGWKGFALNIAGRYGVNDNWLMMNNNQEEWYVMFHGTQFNAMKNIMNTGFKLGIAQGFEDDICLITKKKIGKGVYFSNHIEVCQGFAESTQIGKQSFLLAFQSRVRPDALRQCEKLSDVRGYLDDYKKKNKFINPSLNDMKLWDNDYFLINDPCDIRPYRILLKKVYT